MTESSRSPDVFPVLRYKDGDAAIQWLSDAFGFRRHFEARGEDNSITHAELAFGSGMIMLSGAKPDPANPWSMTDHGVYIHVENVDAHCARAKAAGAEIVRPLADTGYGSREYSARDLDGRLWSFGTYRP